MMEVVFLWVNQAKKRSKEMGNSGERKGLFPAKEMKEKL